MEFYDNEILKNRRLAILLSIFALIFLFAGLYPAGTSARIGAAALCGLCLLFALTTAAAIRKLRFAKLQAQTKSQEMVRRYARDMLTSITPKQVRTLQDVVVGMEWLYKQERAFRQMLGEDFPDDQAADIWRRVKDDLAIHASAQV